MNNETSYVLQRVDKDAMALLDSAQDASNKRVYNAGLIKRMLTMLTSTHKKMLQTSSFRKDDLRTAVLTALALQKQILRHREIDPELNTTDERFDALEEISKRIEDAISAAAKEVIRSPKSPKRKKTKRKKTKKRKTKKKISKRRKSKKKKRSRTSRRKNRRHARNSNIKKGGSFENKCDRDAIRVSEYDSYSIHSIAHNVMAKPIMSENLAESTSHNYIDIQNNANNCFITIGLKMDDKSGLTGILRWHGTELSSPDVIYGVCKHRYEKCMDDRQKKDMSPEKKHAECKEKCIGIPDQLEDNIFRGKIVKKDGVEQKGMLTATQANIINFFLINRKKKVDEKTGRIEYVYELPFTFSWTPDFCTREAFGLTGSVGTAAEYYNCQKFASVFHTEPDNLWNILKKFNKDAQQ
jgi:hypothetical protein